MGGLLAMNNERTMSQLEALVPESIWQQKLWHQLKTNGFPDKNDESWKYTSLKNFINMPLTSAFDLSCDTKVMEYLNNRKMSFDCYQLVFINGQYSVRHSDWIPQIEIKRLDPVLSNKMKQLSSFVNKEFFSQLTDATAKSSICINIPDNLMLDKPIYIIQLNIGGKGEVSTSKIHLTIEKQAQLSLIEHHISPYRASGVSLSRITTEVGHNAIYSHTKVIEEGLSQLHFGHNDLVINRDSKVSNSTFMLSGNVIRHHNSAHFSAEGSSLQMDSLALPSSNETFDTRTFLRHGAPHCDSQQLHKIICMGSGMGVFDGMIHVDRHAIKTDGQMDNHNLLLTESAQVNSKPKLEIYADDVKCSHGATTGQLDPEKIFYLQSRSIPKPKAKKLLIKAFANDVCEKTVDSSLKSILQEKIDSRLEHINV